MELEPRQEQGSRRGKPVTDDNPVDIIQLPGLSKKWVKQCFIALTSLRIIVWFVLICGSFVAGMVTMATLNIHHDIQMTTSATPPIENTTSTGISVTTTSPTTLTTTAPTSLAMLFLSTQNPRNWFDLILSSDTKDQSKNWIKSHTPRLIDTASELSTSFDLNGKELYQSCGVTFQNKYFVFGGVKDKHQIIELEDCSLTTIGNLDFNYHRGACDSTDKVIVLCFDYHDGKRCRQSSLSTGPWYEMALSSHYHCQTSIATSPGS